MASNEAAKAPPRKIKIKLLLSPVGQQAVADLRARAKSSPAAVQGSGPSPTAQAKAKPKHSRAARTRAATAATSASDRKQSQKGKSPLRGSFRRTPIRSKEQKLHGQRAGKRPGKSPLRRRRTTTSRKRSKDQGGNGGAEEISPRSPLPSPRQADALNSPRGGGGGDAAAAAPDVGTNAQHDTIVHTADPAVIHTDTDEQQVNVDESDSFAAPPAPTALTDVHIRLLRRLLREVAFYDTRRQPIPEALQLTVDSWQPHHEALQADHPALASVLQVYCVADVHANAEAHADKPGLKVTVTGVANVVQNKARSPKGVSTARTGKGKSKTPTIRQRKAAMRHRASSSRDVLGGRSQRKKPELTRARSATTKGRRSTATRRSPFSSRKRAITSNNAKRTGTRKSTARRRPVPSTDSKGQEKAHEFSQTIEELSSQFEEEMQAALTMLSQLPGDASAEFTELCSICEQPVVLDQLSAHETQCRRDWQIENSQSFAS